MSKNSKVSKSLIVELCGSYPDLISANELGEALDSKLEEFVDNVCGSDTKIKDGTTREEYTIECSYGVQWVLRNKNGERIHKHCSDSEGKQQPSRDAGKLVMKSFGQASGQCSSSSPAKSATDDEFDF